MMEAWQACVTQNIRSKAPWCIRDGFSGMQTSMIAKVMKPVEQGLGFRAV